MSEELIDGEFREQKFSAKIFDTCRIYLARSNCAKYGDRYRPSIMRCAVVEILINSDCYAKYKVSLKNLEIVKVLIVQY
jgi:hypothetical protein